MVVRYCFEGWGCEKPQGPAGTCEEKGWWGEKKRRREASQKSIRKSKHTDRASILGASRVRERESRPKLVDLAPSPLGADGVQLINEDDGRRFPWPAKGVPDAAWHRPR